MSERAGEPDEEPPIVNITGERVALGPLRRDLIPLYQRWNNDFNVTRTLARSLPTTLEAETAMFEEILKNEQHTPFTIYERATWRPIGATYLVDIDYRDRTAEFGIWIGERDCQGKGYGTEVTRLMLDYAFTALGLHSVSLTVHSYNEAGRRAYEKAGFKEIGRRRECLWLRDRLWDEVLMDCLATEFESPVLADIFSPDEPRR